MLKELSNDEAIAVLKDYVAVECLSRDERRAIQIGIASLQNNAPADFDVSAMLKLLGDVRQTARDEGYRLVSYAISKCITAIIKQQARPGVDDDVVDAEPLFIEIPTHIWQRQDASVPVPA